MFSFHRIVQCCTGILLAVAFSAVGQAMATCNQADVAGRWQAYSLGYQQGQIPYWLRCTLQVKPNGVFENTTSSCTSNTGATSPAFGIVQLIGTQDCIFNGFIHVNGARSDVTRATMNQSKDHIDGVGTFPGGIFFFNLTRLAIAPAVTPTPPSTGGFTCAGKRTCGEMSSCAEARFYVQQCGLRDLDADTNGVPCESICSGG